MRSNATTMAVSGLVRVATGASGGLAVGATLSAVDVSVPVAKNEGAGAHARYEYGMASTTGGSVIALADGSVLATGPEGDLVFGQRESDHLDR
ncbi:MAG: hypothetical protein LBJ02_11510 [Bifidobacteriaceae bacterium]|jgi:hypothetical protein|nr:hypothetical protein [Bifidobacteriaceae bacterium]